MALKINTQTNLNDMFDKFASIPSDKEQATGPDPKHHEKMTKKSDKDSAKSRKSKVTIYADFHTQANRKATAENFSEVAFLDAKSLAAFKYVLNGAKFTFWIADSVLPMP